MREGQTTGLNNVIEAIVICESLKNVRQVGSRVVGREGFLLERRKNERDLS